MNALAGTILGAVVGGGCSILAVRMTLYVERKQRHISDRREKQALTGGLADEIDCLFGMYKQLVYEPLEAVNEGDILWVRFYARQRYFSFYEARAGDVSGLSPEVRRSVIRAYSTARSMLEGLAVHTSLLEKYEEISQSAGKEESTADILRQRLITNTRQLREFHGVMCAVTEQTLTQLRQESAR
ncbi:hypothetical protein EJD04_23015 [Salmonella enterica]|nr:hypothetical protein [Salmonella enterica]EBH0783104.1 hypothetical protein [Salmonella enterica]ECK3229550.1 hypothetical protein [Salmonella enterica]EDE6687370.1 hypothetical protein [Salmonella enterica subsp. enterica serovar Apeyeme]EKL0024113.1 hypothetical protein [Salmonella enterica]